MLLIIGAADSCSSSGDLASGSIRMGGAAEVTRVLLYWLLHHSQVSNFSHSFFLTLMGHVWLISFFVICLQQRLVSLRVAGLAGVDCFIHGLHAVHAWWIVNERNSGLPSAEAERRWAGVSSSASVVSVGGLNSIRQHLPAQGSCFGLISSSRGLTLPPSQKTLI